MFTRLTLRALAALSAFTITAARPVNDGTWRAIEEVLARMATAVRSQDGELMLSAYVREAPLEFSSHGTVITSRDSLAAIYRAWDSTQVMGTYIEFSDVRMRTVGRNAVLVTAHLALARGTPTGTSPDTLRGGWSGLFERRAGRWGLSHEHESFALQRK